jgi:hypothetical protein
MLALVAVSHQLYSQNFVGMKEPAITRFMGSKMPDYTREKGIVNNSYKYMRYVSEDGRQTLLVFFNGNGICNEVRLNFDKSLYTAKMTELNSSYTKLTEFTWTEKKGGRNYAIALTDDNWYYTLKFREITK